jgi:hypothetical protein
VSSNSSALSWCDLARAGKPPPTNVAAARVCKTVRREIIVLSPDLLCQVAFRPPQRLQSPTSYVKHWGMQDPVLENTPIVGLRLHF